MEALEHLEGVLLDIDGVLTTSWRALPGAIDAVAWLRSSGLPFRLLTNTTTHTRSDLARTLREAGIDVDPEEIVTAVIGTATYLRERHPAASVFLLSDGDATADLEGIRIVERARAGGRLDSGAPQRSSDGDVVVIGGACDAFEYGNLNHAFRLVMGGAALVGMHRNLYWRTADGLSLDGGAYIAALEEATGVAATICGKPSAEFFGAALDTLGVSADRAVMVGDDVVNDVLGAQRAGLRGVLVRTGKFQPSDLERGEPDRTIDSIADLPRLTEAS